MIDFHCHVLPGMDDGADSVETSLAMLRESRRQGVALLCATSHFYADEEDPAAFLSRRAAAYDALREAMGEREPFPRLLLGAEILYFPGMSGAQELRQLRLQHSPYLLVEPPMAPWSDMMLDELEQCGESLRCVPVIAHIDRYMRMLGDYSLFERVKDRQLMVQVNASFFLHRDTRSLAVRTLREHRFHFIGSDCHNTAERPQNLAYAAQCMQDAGVLHLMQEQNARLLQVLDLEPGS